MWRCFQTNRLNHQKPWEQGLNEAIRERHSVRAASRCSLKLVRWLRDLCFFFNQRMKTGVSRLKTKPGFKGNSREQTIRSAFR